MQIRIRHLSGSRKGEEQTFDLQSLGLGREPSNEVSFDPYRDRLVSGRHAELSFDGRVWVARDLNSSNGTFVNGEQITSRPLKSGDSIELGQGGPLIEVRYGDDAPAARDASDAVPAADRAGTTIVSVGDLFAGRRTAGGSAAVPPPPPGGGTTMLDANELATIRAKARQISPDMPPPRAAQPPKKTPVVRIALIGAVILLAFAVLMVVLSGGGKKTAPVATKTDTADQSRAELERLKKQLAAREAELAQLQQQQTQTAATQTNAIVSQDLERQYRTSQEQIDKLRTELQQKNDAVTRAENRAPRTIVKYVPQPQPQSQPVSAPAPAIDENSRQTPAPQIAQQTPIAPEPAPRRAPAPLPPAPVEVRPQTVHNPPAAQPVVETAPAEPLRLVTNKTLKKRITLGVDEGDTAASGAPPNLASDLVRSLTSTLATTGTTIVDRNAGGPAIRLSVSSYHNSSDMKVNTGGVTDAVRGIGSILGRGSIPNAPAKARKVDYDIAISLLVTVYDAQGRQLASSRPNCALKQSRSNVTIDAAHVSYGELFSGDSPVADAMRQVVAGAADAVLGSLDRLESDSTIRSVRSDSVTLDLGRNANVGPDDVFDVIDGGRPVARLRVESVQDSTSSARILLNSGGNLTGKRARYVGTVADAASDAQRGDRNAVAREKSDVRDGPGLSFKPHGNLSPNARVRVLYSVGPWARVDYAGAGGASWVPMASIDLQ